MSGTLVRSIVDNALSEKPAAVLTAVNQALAIKVSEQVHNIRRSIAESIFSEQAVNDNFRQGGKPTELSEAHLKEMESKHYDETLAHGNRIQQLVKEFHGGKRRVPVGNETPAIAAHTEAQRAHGKASLSYNYIPNRKDSQRQPDPGYSSQYTDKDRKHLTNTARSAAKRALQLDSGFTESRDKFLKKRNAEIAAEKNTVLEPPHDKHITLHESQVKNIVNEYPDNHKERPEYHLHSAAALRHKIAKTLTNIDPMEKEHAVKQADESSANAFKYDYINQKSNRTKKNIIDANPDLKQEMLHNAQKAHESARKEYSKHTLNLIK